MNRKFIKLKKNLRSLPSKLIPISLISRLNKLKRTAKTGKVDVKLPTISSRRVLGISLAKIFYALLGFILFLLLLVTVIRYISIEPTRSYLDPDPVLEAKDSNQTNVAIVVYEQEDPYAYVDFIMILSVNYVQDSVKAIIVSPNYGIIYRGQRIKLKNILAHAEATKESPLGIMLPGIERMLGVKLHSYVTVENNDVLDIFKNLNLQTDVVETFSDRDAGTFIVGTNVQGSNLKNYLASEFGGEDMRMWRQARFLTQVLKEGITMADLPAMLLNYREYLGLFDTNMSREQLVSLVTKLLSASEYEVSYLKTVDSYYIEDQKIYEPNVSAVNHQIRRLFARTKVVKEQARIEIYNGTRISGLASAYKRQMENLGGNVIRATNASEPQEKSKLYVTDLAKYASNVEMIREITEDRILVIEDIYPYQHAGEIVLVIGADIVE